MAMLPKDNKTLMPVAKNAAKNIDSVAEGLEFRRREKFEMCGEILNTALASFLQDGFAFLGGSNVHAARVRRVGGDLDQLIAG
jgi:hypothetical protein